MSEAQARIETDVVDHHDDVHAGPPDEAMPKRFGKYTLIRKLAQGGMAELFLALQRSMAGFEKLIVVKRILPKLAEDKSFVEMLLSEARIAATLNHPNIAHIYDVGCCEDQYFIAMEHVHGEDLRSIARQMKKQDGLQLPLEHVLAIALGCCSGLAYAHTKTDLDGNPLGIVHRDVSPQNILVTFTGDVKIVDFGVAIASTAPTEKSGSLKGKVGYMSPEQVHGRTLDARSDVFALGIVLFELLTNRRLFRGTDPIDTLRKVLTEPVPSMRELDDRIPERLEEIVMKALARDRDERYESAHEMQADLEAFIRQERLAVSSISLGKFLQDLFADKLTQQKKMLQEGRQLAEVLTSSSDSEETNFSLAGGTLSTSIRPRQHRGPPKYAVVLVVLAAMSISAMVALTSTPSPPPPARPQAPAVVAPPSPGVLTVRSTPTGARILLDGRDIGRVTPASIPDITPGTTHTVVLAHDGFVPRTERFEVAAGGAHEVAVELDAVEANRATLGIVVTPPDATVKVDGVAIAVADLAGLRVAPGEHRVVVERTGYRSEERTIALRIAETSRIEIMLARAPSERSEGRTEPVRPNPPVAAGPGTLTFNSRPWCNVSIDGSDVGQTPIVNRSLPSGPHRVACTNPDLGVTRTFNVTIRPGETTRQNASLQ